MRVNRSLIVIIVAACGAAIWFGYHRTAVAGVQIVFLSVGQGDCIVIQDGAHTALIDAGPSSDTFDSGERLIAPKLRALGVKRIDVVLISHPDSDHIGGLSGIAKRFRIGSVTFPKHFEDSDALNREFMDSGIEPARMLAIESGTTIRFDRISMTAWSPSWDAGASDNEGSMFVKLQTSSGAAAVFSGDADESTELKMASMADWRADVFKAGHHGSKFSTSAAFLNRVKPKWVVFSCGRGNMYGHPSDDAMRRTRSIGAKALRTDLDGDVRFKLVAGAWELAD